MIFRKYKYKVIHVKKYETKDVHYQKDYILKAQERHLSLTDTPIDSYL